MASTASYPRYDRPTVIFHWLTAILIVSLFVLAETWHFAPRGAPRREMQYLHISLGLTLAVLFVVRAVWRLTRGRRLPAASTGMAHWAAKAVHLGFYVLLVMQIGLGFFLRWAQGQAFTFFGLFPIPAPFAVDKGLRRTLESFHNDIAWVIITLAAAHAIAALVHHYVLRDGVLKRMK